MLASLYTNQSTWIWQVSAPLPIGAVPIRYVLGMMANVVPVETVLTNEAGTVSCRVRIGPANVVPVRETTTETPRVKIRLV